MENTSVAANCGQKAIIVGRIRTIHELDDGMKVKAKVYMKVFRNEKGHKAYAYSDSDCTFCYGYMNMGKCNVEAGENSKRVCITTLKCHADYGTTSKGLVFETRNSLEAKKWIACLSRDSVTKTTRD